MEFAAKLLQKITPTEGMWIYFLLAGLVLFILGYYWMAFRAVRESSLWWRLGYIPPFALFYLPFRLGKVIAPLMLMLLGGLLLATPFVFTRVIEPMLPRHPWEKMVNGELHLTVTGLKAFDYADLKKSPKAVVLQMANAEVDDATLDHLADMISLKELDLTDTRITDAGLEKLKALPALTSLRLRNTKITDAGFRAGILPREWIMEVDVRDTEVKSATMREWKKAKEDRKYLK